jgi:hypothetical protein
MNRPANEITSLSANTQAMGLPEFLAQANPMMQSVDSAMAQIFGGKRQTAEEIREQLERAEDEFIARKEMEARSNKTFLDEVAE